MRKILCMLWASLSLFACSTENEGLEPNETDVEINEDDNGSDDETSGDSSDITPILEKFSGTGLSYEITANTVIFTTQDLPDHTSPYWPTDNPLYEAYTGTNLDWRQNPGTIAAQNIVFSIPLNPAEASNKQVTRLGPIGLARNGVVFFNQYAAGNEPLTNEINSFDQWLGHPANTTYHYHIEPAWLTEQFGEDAFLGLLADGFPIYGPLENNEVVTNGDLDEYHGHFGTTVDFPNGIYHYHITAEDPYLNGNGYFGTPGDITR